MTTRGGGGTYRFNVADMAGLARTLAKAEDELVEMSRAVARSTSGVGCAYPPGLGESVQAETKSISFTLRAAADGYRVEAGWMRRCVTLLKQDEGRDWGNVVVGGKLAKAALEEMDQSSRRIDRRLARADSARRWAGFGGDLVDHLTGNRLLKAGATYANLRAAIREGQSLIRGLRAPRLQLNNLKQKYRTIARRLEKAKPPPKPGSSGLLRAGRAAGSVAPIVATPLDAYGLKVDVDELRNQRHSGVRGTVEKARDTVAVGSSGAHLTANALYASGIGAPVGLAFDAGGYAGDAAVLLTDGVTWLTDKL